MAEDGEVEELTEEQQAALTLKKELDERMPLIATAEEYKARVQDDVENLVFLVAVSAQCTHCSRITPQLHALSAQRTVTKNARFYRLDVHSVPNIAQDLHVSQTPTSLFFLKGAEWQRHVGAGMEKVAALFRNNLIKRNEVMREYDLAKIAKPEEEGNGEEAEETEEHNEEEQ